MVLKEVDVNPEIPTRIMLAHAVENGVMTKMHMRNRQKTSYWFFTPKTEEKK